ncbi:lipoprotein signal peptidase [Allopusillimonas soli]|uniref:Lipoprotein signal peptidase n=2 Tax=Allopusillimonas soli TaxID=659016 RepID=A0A853FEW8_9BURK|nr:lipoprotein signal peptidase [Allopusillimonas soli]TEA75491.1 lipoprotein signal peptidase [Allopusillimonas soli]
MPEANKGRKPAPTGLARAGLPDHGGNAGAQAPSPRWMGRFAGWLLLALVLVIVDQLTKAYFDSHLVYGERWHLLPFFDFTLLYNPGAAFSFLAGGQGWQRWLFTAIALGAAVLILYLLRRNTGQPLFCAALACVLGGAVGNVIDRILHGHVVDFLLFYWHDWFFPAFNIADVAITCGAILLVLDELLRMRRERRAASVR